MRTYVTHTHTHTHTHTQVKLLVPSVTVDSAYARQILGAKMRSVDTDMWAARESQIPPPVTKKEKTSLTARVPKLMLPSPLRGGVGGSLKAAVKGGVNANGSSGRGRVESKVKAVPLSVDIFEHLSS